MCISKGVVNYVYGYVKDHNEVSGNVAKPFLYYNKLDAILGTRAASLSVVVLDSCGNAVEPVVTTLDTSEQENGVCIAFGKVEFSLIQDVQVSCIRPW